MAVTSMKAIRKPPSQFAPDFPYAPLPPAGRPGPRDGSLRPEERIAAFHGQLTRRTMVFPAIAVLGPGKVGQLGAGLLTEAGFEVTGFAAARPSVEASRPRLGP